MAAAAAPAPAGPTWRNRFLLAAGVAAAATALALVGWARARAAADQPTTWEFISLGDSAHVTMNAPGLALSPDGNTLIVKDEIQDGLLWAKRSGTLIPTPIPGTERGVLPAFSPDGEWLLYLANGQLRKVRLANGASVKLADSASLSLGFGGAAWLDDGSIVYVPSDLGRIIRIDENGGSPQVVLNNSTLQGLGFGYPAALPGSRGVLFEGCTSGCVTMSLRVLDLRTGAQKLLVNEATNGWYLPTGHLIYARRDGTVLAAPFDLDKLELMGTGVPVLDRVAGLFGSIQLAWSPSGVLVYAAGDGRSTETILVRVGMDGRATPVDTSWAGVFTSLAISPNGRNVAVGAGTGAGALNIWTKQLDHGPYTRASFGGADRRPVWSPDGKVLAFIRDTLTTSVVIGRTADGSRGDTVLMHIDRQAQEVDWSRDGRWLVVRTDNGSAGAGDLVGKRTSGDTSAVPLVDSRFTELNPAISPDSRWLAYASNESGVNEVFVRPFPNTREARWQVSNGGGFQPRWSPDGRTLYYINPTSSRMMAVPVSVNPTFSSGQPRDLFSTNSFSVDGFHTTYEVTPDGRSFLFVAPRIVGVSSAPPQLVRVDHWFRDIKARVAQ